MLKNKKIILPAICLACCGLLIAFYSAAYPSHLLWQEQNQIFLNTPHWISTYFSRPAWLGCLAGDWLTQFYIYPVAGAVILTLAIAGSTACTAVAARRLFLCNGAGARRILPQAAAILPAALFLLLMIACSMPASSSLSFFMCVAGGLAMGLLRIRIPAGKNRSIDASPLLTVASFWAFGFGALITAALTIAFSLRGCPPERSLKSRLATAVAAAVLAAATPAILCASYSLPYKKALLYPGLTAPSLPEFRQERRLAVADAFFLRDYPRTKQLALTAPTPDDITAFYYYLASAVQDSLPDNLLKYPVRNLGTLTTIGDDTPLPVINMMNDLYYELGDMTYAERAAMMRNVFSPRNRNVRMMKRLAEVNLVSGDTLAAMKYLRILNLTIAYSGWSGRHTPGRMSEKAGNDVARRRAFTNTKENIRLGDNCRHILLELLESNPHNSVALDYLLCTDLLLKDMDTFKQDYDEYCMKKGSPRYKKLYQEALMIYLAGTDAPAEEWNRYITDRAAKESFRLYSDRRGDPAFLGTYWYYFDKQ